MIVLGLDPGFRDLGFAAIEFTRDGERPVAAGVIRTKKSTKKQNVLATEDNVRCGRELGEQLEMILAALSPVLVCTESQSWPRNAGASAKVGIAWGVVINATRSLPMAQASPQEIKRIVVGAKNASKADVELEVARRWNLSPLLEGVTESKRNHAYDAAGAVIACMESDVFRALHNLL